MSMNKTQRCQAAIDYRRQGLNCSQCLLAAFADVAGLTLEQAMALGAGMGGGVRCGSICGAVSTPVMLLGTQASMQGLKRLKEVMRLTSSLSIWAVIS